MAVGATPNGLPILWVVDVLFFFLEIADLFGLVFAKSGSLILVHALTYLSCDRTSWQNSTKLECG